MSNTLRAKLWLRDHLPRALIRPFWPRPGVRATYNSDGFATMHNADFQHDPAFFAAYASGASTPHRFGASFGFQWNIYVLCWAAKHGLELEGDFVECGVNTGIFSRTVVQYVGFGHAVNKRFFLLDTFEGIPLEQLSATEVAAGAAAKNIQYYDCYESVRETFRPYPNVILVRGTIPQTLHEVDSEKIAYLSIDLNAAYPERCCLDFFWDRLVPGAVVVLDDYGWADHSEQKVAHDAFARERSVAILPLPTGQGLLVKGAR